MRSSPKIPDRAVAAPPARIQGSVISIRGAREHNLKNLDLDLPRDRLVVITGLSGSGKSSLAFDTLYAEGQRRYVESLSAYARQFLGLMEKPDVDRIDGLSPAISIEQKSSGHNPRSTVGTVTEIYDYLRLLYARLGTPHCHRCGREITRQTSQEIIDRLFSRPSGTRLTIYAPLVRGRKGEYQELLKNLVRDGFNRVRVDGKVRSLDEPIRLDRKRKHTLEVVIDRLVVKPEGRERLADSVELALRQSGGLVVAAVEEDGTEELFSEQFACPDCGISIAELSPRLFSFNSPHGACPTCTGLGFKMELDERLIVPNPMLSLRQGALASVIHGIDTWFLRRLAQLAEHYNFSLDTPFAKLPRSVQELIFYGSNGRKIKFRYESPDGKTLWVHEGVWEGVIPNLARRYHQTKSPAIREWIEGFMGHVDCPDCRGERLKPEARAVTVRGLSISRLTDMTIDEAAEFFRDFNPTAREVQIGRQIFKEVTARLGFLRDVGLGYLTLSRPAGTLSGGEAQRIRLATQIGSGLVGVMYILDEPSIGLHQRDNQRLISTLKGLRDLGNTVIVVEHDRETIESADWVVDLGPGAGADGGWVVAAGTPDDVRNEPASVTGRFLAGTETIPVPGRRRRPDGRFLLVKGASGNNLKTVDVRFPLGLFTVVTGVSGSGKSSLVVETLYPALARRLNGAHVPVLPHHGLEGVGQVDKVVDIDQSPIGRTPRSNPATYTGLFDLIRDLFAQLPEAKMRGYRPGRFSFNVRGGRCEACEGAGIIRIEMHFLPDVYVTCDVCKGRRYNAETLEVRYRGKTIADVLDMSADQARDFFRDIPGIRRKLDTICGVGLGYIRLGQPATTLSGGEAQRIKLAAELSRVATGRTVYILDEPTTGLHFADIRMLLTVLQELVDKGNTVIVIEHHLDVIKCADWVIDLGPEGGGRGGFVVAEGAPEAVAKVAQSWTGRFLAKVLPSV